MRNMKYFVVMSLAVPAIRRLTLRVDISIFLWFQLHVFTWLGFLDSPCSCGG